MGIVLEPIAYGKLCERTLPKIITDDIELDRMTAALEELDFKESRTPEEQALADLLGKLINDYESDHHSIPEATPLETLQHLMQEHNLRQADLLNVFGTRNVASDVCNGKRSISKAQAKKLAERFKVSADLFI